MVSKARLLFPDPERPVITTSLSRGMTTSIFFRVCSRAPRTTIVSWGILLDHPSPQGRRLLVWRAVCGLYFDTNVQHSLLYTHIAVDARAGGKKECRSLRLGGPQSASNISCLHSYTKTRSLWPLFPIKNISSWPMSATLKDTKKRRDAGGA